jgi:hypothetical protein
MRVFLAYASLFFRVVADFLLLEIIVFFARTPKTVHHMINFRAFADKGCKIVATVI